MSEKTPTPTGGYGNIYTPHAGSMIISVQREGGLANRTIVVSPNKIRLLRFVASRRGAVVGAIIAASWLFFAVQATRVPLLTDRIAEMERDAERLDTLQFALAQLQQRYEQVQAMLGIAAPPLAVAPTAPTEHTRPDQWPLPQPGYVTRGIGAADEYAGAHPGIDVAVPVGTEVRAAGGASVVEVDESAEYGKFVRLRHADQYETLYAHLSEVRVARGDVVGAGSVIALSGNTGRSTAPHLHFEVRRAGTVMDPMQLIKRTRTRNGDVHEGSDR